MPPPYVVKPVNEGSSVGVEIIAPGRQPPRRDRARLALQRRGAGRGIHSRPRADRRRDGRSRARGDRDRREPQLLRLRVEIRRRRLAPRDPGASFIPRLTRARWASRSPRIARSAAAARRARISATTIPQAKPGRLVLLEVNTQPGLTPTSLLPEQAAHVGMSFPRALRLDGGERRMSRVDASPPQQRQGPARPAEAAAAPAAVVAAAGRHGPRSGWSRCCWFAFLVTLKAAGQHARHRARAVRQRQPPSCGLRVQNIVIEGRANTPEPLLRAALGVTTGEPILGFSVADARARIETLSWVEHATVERRLPSTIVVNLVERRPFAIWQNQGKFVLIDRERPDRRGSGRGAVQQTAARRRPRRAGRRGGAARRPGGPAGAAGACRRRGAHRRAALEPAAAIAARTCCCRKAPRPRRSNVCMTLQAGSRTARPSAPGRRHAPAGPAGRAPDARAARA